MTWPNPLVALDAETESCGQKRADPRSHIFVAAVIYHGGASRPVRIRNMSRGGALVECAAPPPVHSAVRLCRGSLSARGVVAWQRGGSAGIRFDGDIEVAAWLPKGNRPQAQEQVDAIVHAYRSKAGRGMHHLASPAAVTTNNEINLQLLEIRDLLHQAAEELAGNPAIAASHAQSLQAIDLSAHRLEKLAGVLAGGAQIPPSTGS